MFSKVASRLAFTSAPTSWVFHFAYSIVLGVLLSHNLWKFLTVYLVASLVIAIFRLTAIINPKLLYFSLPHAANNKPQQCSIYRNNKIIIFSLVSRALQPTLSPSEDFARFPTEWLAGPTNVHQRSPRHELYAQPTAATSLKTESLYCWVSRSFYYSNRSWQVIDIQKSGCMYKCTCNIMSVVCNNVANVNLTASQLGRINLYIYMSVSGVRRRYAWSNACISRHCTDKWANGQILYWPLRGWRLPARNVATCWFKRLQRSSLQQMVGNSFCSFICIYVHIRMFFTFGLVAGSNLSSLSACVRQAKLWRASNYDKVKFKYGHFKWDFYISVIIFNVFQK